MQGQVRNYTTTEKLIFVIIILIVLDLVTTAYGLTFYPQHMKENNPLSAFLIEKMGLGFWLSMNIISSAIIFTYILYRGLKIQNAFLIAVLLFLLAFRFFCLFNNLWVIARAIGW